jgi:hypothetical protein
MSCGREWLFTIVTREPTGTVMLAGLTRPSLPMVIVVVAVEPPPPPPPPGLGAVGLLSPPPPHADTIATSTTSPHACHRIVALLTVLGPSRGANSYIPGAVDQ